VRVYLLGCLLAEGVQGGKECPAVAAFCTASPGRPWPRCRRDKEISTASGSLGQAFAVSVGWGKSWLVTGYRLLVCGRPLPS
jgi:hypothetical protein